MQKKIRRWTLRTGATVGASVILATTLWLAPASATELGSWERATTGASGSGDIEVINGYVYNFLHIADTKADGHCAYVVTTFDHHDAFLKLWFAVGTDRVTDCGNGTYTVDTSYMSLDAMSQAFTDMIRVKVRVCRDINNAPDNCSGTYQSPTYPV
jgi:hypothetical protein